MRLEEGNNKGRKLKALTWSALGLKEMQRSRMNTFQTFSSHNFHTVLVLKRCTKYSKNMD